MPQIFIVIPAKNEARQIGRVITQIQKEGFANIIVVDDGSSDNTAQIARKHKAIVLKHLINRGAGAATYTGLQAALFLKADIVVTLDADGQHAPGDIPALIKPVLQKKADIAIGSRVLNKKNMPVLRRFFNTIGNFVTWFLFGLWVSDSQSGFKAFSRVAAKQIEIKTNGYEFCSEIIREIKFKKLAYFEVPIHTHYSLYSLQKGQNFTNGVKTFGKLLLRSLMP